MLYLLQIAVLDTGSAEPSVIFVTDCISNSKSPITSLSVRTCPTRQNPDDKSDNETESASGPEVVFVLTKDAQMVLMDCSTGNMISSQPTNPEEKSIAISMHILGKCAPCLQFYAVFQSCRIKIFIFSEFWVQTSVILVKGPKVLSRTPSIPKLRMRLQYPFIRIRVVCQMLKQWSLILGTRWWHLEFYFVVRKPSTYTL